MENQLEDLVSGQRVLFISTKNKDYIRNSQELRLLKDKAARVTAIVSNSSSYPKRLLFVYFYALLALFKRDFDVLFVGFAPQLLFVLFPFFPRSKVLILDFFISFFDTLVDDRKKFRLGRFPARFLHFLDWQTIHKANLVIADTKAHRDYFAAEFHYPLQKIQVLYLVADDSIYQVEQAVKSDKTQFEVLYFGSILPVQGVEVIMSSMQLLTDWSKIHFTIIGPVKADKSNFPHTTFYDWLSQPELAEKIAQADLTLAGHFAADIGKANRTIAGKTYIYEAMNKPMILGDSAANHELFKPDQQHIFVPRGDAQALADAILQYYYEVSQ